MTPERARTIRNLAILLVVAVGLCVFYFIADLDSRLMPQCLFHRLTGWQCPGCGLQRMAHALLHGNFVEAMQYNLLVPALLPLAGVMVWIDLTRRNHPRRYSRFYSKWLMAIVIAMLLGWLLIRNILGI